MKEIKVPILPESITEATVAAWHKKPGDFVEIDDVVVEIETDKVVLEVPAEESGVLSEISADLLRFLNIYHIESFTNLT